MKKILSAAIALFILAVGSNAHAVTHNVVAGQLLGATGVIVGGKTYDVQFVEGSCIDLFNGCDNPLTDFAFSNYADANLARIALSEQVFTDSAAGNFDSVPSLTNGLASEGNIITPYRFGTGAFSAYVAGTTFFNAILEASDTIRSTFFLPPSQFTGFYADRTYAKWTVSAVPLPAAFPLYGAGIAILGFLGWRRKRHTPTA